MKLSLAIPLLFTSVFQVNALTFGQSITLEKKSVKLSVVLKDIQRQSGYNVFYNEALINKEKRVDVNLKNVHFKTALEMVLDDQELDFKFVDKNIILSKRINTPNGAPTENNIIQKRKISGIVTDQEGNPLSDVTVTEKGTTNRVVSQANGRFQIVINEQNAVLQFSNIGFESKELGVNYKSDLKVALTALVSDLDEVVVVGYGTQKKVNLTATVETVNRKVLENRPVKTVSEMLEGVVPNLNISTTSGAPDASSSLNIRGFTGMNQRGEPLVLVDGVEQNIDFVNANDIESISVLKDAAASAIYGSRAPYGVILITTKSGEIGKPVSVQYVGSYQLNQLANKPKSASSVDFAKIHNNSFRNSLVNPQYPESVIQKMQDYIDGKLDTYNVVSPNGWWGEHFESFANTDYYDYAFRDVSQNTSHDVNVSGGTEKSKYYAAIGANYREGVYNSSIDDYSRYSALLKVDTEVSKWLSFNMNMRYARQNTVRPSYRGASNSSSSDSTFFDQLSYYPNIPIKNPDGSWHRVSAMPLLTGEQGKIDRNIDDFWLSGGVKVTPMKGLDLKAALSWNRQGELDTRTNYVIYVDQPNGQSVRSARSSTLDKLWRKNSNANYFTMDLTADYKKTIGGHDFAFLVGFQTEEKKNNNTIGTLTGMYTQELPSFNLSWGDNMKLTDEINHWSTVGTFFRASYNYENRYLLDFNGRYDAASKYPKDSRWAFFPSVSAGWNIARESFWNIDAVNSLKITGSYGKLGDQTGGNYLFIPTMGTGTMGSMVLNNSTPRYVSLPGIISDRITWAKPQSIGFGLETTMLSNRLSLEYHWYQRTVYDQLGPASTLPEVLGAKPPQTNNAVSETRGWEIMTSWRDKAFLIKDFPLNYNLRLTLSDYVGYVVSYPDNVTGARSSWTPGQVFGELYGYRSNGIATTAQDLQNNVLIGDNWYYPGDLTYKDLNGDGVINQGIGSTWYSMGDVERLGFTYPRMKYGVHLGADWKGLSLSVFLDGVGKEVAYFNNYSSFGATNDHSSRRLFQQHVDLGYWSENNKDAFFPRSYTTAKNFQNTNDQFMINLSHLRIKNMNVGYTIPSVYTGRLKLSTVRLNFSVENLGFIYNKAWLDLDPQMIRKNGSGYPIQRTYYFGLSVGI